MKNGSRLLGPPLKAKPEPVELDSRHMRLVLWFLLLSHGYALLWAYLGFLAGKGAL